jgi:PAS domain S-box-containing protein
MADDWKKDKGRSVGMRNSRPTIGLLIGRLGDVGYAAQIWPGVADVAEERDVNLICFVGGGLRAAHEFESQRNVAYDLASPENVDGLIAMSGSIGQYIGPEQLRHFYERYHPLPMVSVAMALDGIPSISVDNKTGMRDAITHLIEVHKFSRIAFICGPETNPDSVERYHTYIKVLAEHGIPLDPDLVVPGNFSSSAGAGAIRLLLDERKADFEAVVSVNDEMAIGAMTALQERGLRVPDDVSVVGFDDLEEARYAAPPLTTIRQPRYEQGRRAAEMLLALLAGENVPERVALPTELVLRQSCGCFPQAVYQISKKTKWAGEKFESTSVSWRERILSEMVKAASSSAIHLSPGWAEKLLNAFSDVLEAQPRNIFLPALDDVLRRVGAEGDDVMQWHRVLDVLRYHALPSLASGEALSKGDDLWQRARALIGDVAQWAQANRRLQAERRAFDFTTRISEPLMTAFDVPGLTDVMAQQLPQMGIMSCYLALYEQPVEGMRETPTEWSKLILAYNRDGRIELETDGRRFPSHRLVPEGILSREQRYAVMLEPLHFRDEIQLGFILFEPLQTKAGALREALSRQISIALKGALLLQERAQAQKALQNSEEKYRSLLHFNREILRNAPIGIIRLDSEMKIQYENPELEKIIGLPTEESRSRAMGTDIRKLPSIQAAGLVAALNELQRGKNILEEVPFTSIYGKLTVVRINGCPIRDKGLVVGSVLLVEDISERKGAEEALTASEERYRSLAEASHDMIFIIGKGGSIEYVNGFAARQFGLQPEIITGKNMAEMFSAEVAKRQQENINRVLVTNTPFYFEAPTAFPGGEIWLGTWLVPLRDEGGQATSVMGVSRDITERKQVEKELKEYSERLEEMVGERTAELQDALQKAQTADRMKSEFLANVNHELRTPLTNLILYYQMLSAYPSVKTEERLNVIGRELQRLRSLIENLLNLSRLELEQVTLRPMPHDLNKLIQSLTNDRRAMAEARGLTLTMELRSTLPSIWLDEAMIVQAISNLLTNAMNYTPSGGQLYIRTRALDDESGKPGVAISVQDTGPGIEKDDLPHIFERFYRGSAGHETGAPGTGLGLAIVKEVVERHHGRIEVENVASGHGAVFTVWLPVEQGQEGLTLNPPTG